MVVEIELYGMLEEWGTRAEWNWSRSWFNDTASREGRFGAISRRRIGNISGRNNWGSIIQCSNGSRNRIVWNVRRMRDTSEWNWSRSWFNDTASREGRFGAISRRRIGNISGRNNWGSIIQCSNGSRNRIVWNVRRMRDTSEWNWSRSWFNDTASREGRFGAISRRRIGNISGRNNWGSIIQCSNGSRNRIVWNVRRMRDTSEWNWSRSWFNDTASREGRFGAISRRRIGNISGRNNWGSIFAKIPNQFLDLVVLLYGFTVLSWYLYSYDSYDTLEHPRSRAPTYSLPVY